jgi:hypothetical protein
VIVVLDGPFGTGDARALLDRLRPALIAASDSIVTCNVKRVTEPDIDTVDALARLALAIRRWNCRMLLLDPCPELVELLGLAGLARVLPCAGLAVEVVGQPEQREEALGVEEERDPDDAAI